MPIRRGTGATDPTAPTRTGAPPGRPMEWRNPSDVYDPVAAGEPLPEDFHQIAPRDAIAPIYLPRFTSAEDADYPDRTLVLGIEIDGEARAYPIGVLDSRQMVIDRVGGVPILATW